MRQVARSPVDIWPIVKALVDILLRRRLGQFAFVAVPLALVACACAAVVSLEQRDDLHTSHARQVDRIEMLAARVSAEEWRAIAEKEVSDETTREVDRSLDAMAAILSARDKAEHHVGKTASNALDDYSSAVRDEFEALREGDLEEAEEIDEEHVDPAFEQLEAIVKEIVEDESAIADMADRQALTGSLLVIVLSSAALVALMFMTFRARRRVEIAEVQETTTRVSEQRFAALLQNSSDVLLVLDGEAKVQYASESVSRLVGRRADAVAGGELRQLLIPESHGALDAQLQAAVARPGHPIVAEWALGGAQGEFRFVEAILNDLRSDPRVNGIVVNVREITERRRLESELRRQAFHDELTGLANRLLFEDRVTSALARGDRDATSTAVVFLDLDDFKHVNDSLGHASGDELLRAVASRLQACVRDQDTIARLGGDEFAILLSEIDSIEAAVDVADRVLAELSTPVMVHGNALFVNASIGVALDPAPGEDHHGRFQAMLRDADIAMYAAKSAGKNRIEIFESELHAPIVRRLQLKTEMQAALSQDEFVLHFQPIVALGDDAIIGAEALVRWQHPERGLVPPNDFIPLAEQTGLIVPLGRWVLRAALREAAIWREQDPAGNLRYVSVNVSGQQLESAAFLEEVAEALDAVDLPAEALLIEVTESSLIHDTERNTERLQALRDLGVRLAIDDFGTGYSALNYLRRFPMDILKIDRSFINNVADSGQDAALVEAMIQMSASLGLRVVAEGVEDLEQSERLQELKCSYGQGYFFSRPVPAEELQAVLNRTRSAVVA